MLKLWARLLQILREVNHEMQGGRQYQQLKQSNFGQSRSLWREMTFPVAVPSLPFSHINNLQEYFEASRRKQSHMLCIAHTH